MSFSMVFYFVSVIGAYKLGAYNCRHPGAVVQWSRNLWSWMNK
jgi:hypothetical protein